MAEMQALPRPGTPDLPHRGERLWAAYTVELDANDLKQTAGILIACLRNDYALSAKSQEINLQNATARVRRQMERIEAALQVIAGERLPLRAQEAD